MSEYTLNDRFKHRTTKRKAIVVGIERTPTAGDYIRLEHEDNEECIVVSESNLRINWYRIPKGEGKRKEVATVAKPGKVNEKDNSTK